MKKKRSHRLDKMARVYDEEILPLWSQRFGRMLLRGLTVPPKAMVLDVGCATGYPATEILALMDGGRIIAIEPVSSLLDVARRKVGELSGKRIFFRSESPTSKLAFADEVYDLVVSNLGLPSHDDPPRALKEFARVTKPGGRVLVTLPVSGTFDEFYDIYREVLTKIDEHDVLERLEAHVARTPDADEAASWMEGAGLVDVEVEVEQFSLLFKSSREFFFSPVIEYGPLAAWKEVAGKGQGMQEIFWQIKESIDAYFRERAFEVTVKAGCLRGIKPERRVSPGVEEVTQPRSGEVLLADLVPPAPDETAEASVEEIKDNFLLEEEEEEGAR
jgi:demethylmenaquinone methyltransferase/2-methoxy-6-polyprenyl-1,4-benzoquinol methylase